MNSKERARAAIAKEPVDKIPLGLYVIDHDVISKIIGRPTLVRNKPGMQVAFWEGRRDEVVESMKADVIELYEKLDCVDVLTFKEAQRVPPKGYKPEKPPRKIDENTYEDDNGVWKLEFDANDIMYYPNDVNSAELPEFSPADFEARTLPSEPDPSCFELMDALTERFSKDRYIFTHSVGVAIPFMGKNFEQSLMILALQPEAAKAYNEQQLFIQNHMDRFHIRPGTDGIFVGQDMAGTNGPFVSPEMFREVCFPYYKARIQNMKKYLPQVMLHNCGNNMAIMDMLVDGGIDGYQSIQTTSDMSIRRLVEGYGDRLCVWGAVSLEALISGTKEDVCKSVRRCFEEAKDAKGFILGPSHSIAFGSKYENFMAMLDEFEKLRDRREF